MTEPTGVSDTLDAACRARRYADRAAGEIAQATQFSRTADAPTAAAHALLAIEQRLDSISAHLGGLAHRHRGLDGELARRAEIARGEVARSDTKAALLLALAGAGLAAGAGVLLRVSLPPMALITLAAALLTVNAAIERLLAVVLPRIPRTGGVGFVAHANLGLAELLGHLTADPAKRDLALAQEVLALSRLAVAKYRTLARAVWLLRAALALSVAAGLLAAAGW